MNTISLSQYLMSVGTLIFLCTMLIIVYSVLETLAGIFEVDPVEYKRKFVRKLARQLRAEEEQKKADHFTNLLVADAADRRKKIAGWFDFRA